MNKFFDLAVILSLTTGDTLIEDFSECQKLVCYIYDEKYISEEGLKYLSVEIKKHLLNSHPQLIGLNFDCFSDGDIEDWIEVQKKAYGNKLPVPRLGCVLSRKEKKYGKFA